jgi:hypothetical protein
VVNRRQALSVVAAAAAAALAACDRDGQIPRRRTPAAPADLAPLARPAVGSRFPLRVAAGKSYLVDASGRPFFLVGESAWSLLARLSRPEIEEFLVDRQRRGYNAIMVNVLECYFSDRPPFNSEGRLPFAVPSRFDSAADYVKHVDFDTPVDAYFDLFEFLLERAARLGVLVLAEPSYPGYEGGEQGWWVGMKRSGPGPLRQYGRYLGQRFRTHRNLLWVQGGDYNVPDRRTVEALALGIREYDTENLHTYHGSRGTGAHDWMGDAPWMALGNVYTREVVYDAARRYRAARPSQPFFLIEAYYENYADARPDPRLTRVSAYQALLSGACGQLSGHDDVWQFRPNWRAALDSATARSVRVLSALFQSLEWWRLQPDLDARLLRGGEGEGFERALAAVSTDRRFAMAYVPATRAVTIAPGALAGPRVRAEWVDPIDGHRVPATVAEDAETSLTPPGANSGATSDWVLLLASDG